MKGGSDAHPHRHESGLRGLLVARPVEGGAATGNSAPDDINRETRETLWISPDQNWAEGRWFWGEYQEFGFDVKLVRASPIRRLSGVDQYSLKAGSQGARVHIFGDNLPAQTAPADIDFGAGVNVNKIVSHNDGEHRGDGGCSRGCSSGQTRPGVGTLDVSEGAFAVYDKVDYIKVLPEASLARLGGDEHCRTQGLPAV